MAMPRSEKRAGSKVAAPGLHDPVAAMRRVRRAIVYATGALAECDATLLDLYERGRRPRAIQLVANDRPVGEVRNATSVARQSVDHRPPLESLPLSIRRFTGGAGA
jgi:hypothetical protein